MGQEEFQDRSDLQELEKKLEKVMGPCRTEYPTLSEADVNYKVGGFDDITQRIARRTHRTRETVP